MVAKKVSINIKTKNTFKYDYFPGLLLYLKMHNLQTIETPPKKRLKIVKGYLRYKTIISQNAFYFEEKLCSVLKIFKFLYFLIIPWFTKSVTAWWVLVHETGCILEYIFSTTNHEPTKLGELIDICKVNNFQESFKQCGD